MKLRFRKMTWNSQEAPCAQPPTLGANILPFRPVLFLLHDTGSEHSLIHLEGLFFKGVLYEILQPSSHYYRWFFNIQLGVSLKLRRAGFWSSVSRVPCLELNWDDVGGSTLIWVMLHPRGLQSGCPGPTASASARNLLEKHILQPLPRPLNQERWGWDQQALSTGPASDSQAGELLPFYEESSPGSWRNTTLNTSDLSNLRCSREAGAVGLVPQISGGMGESLWKVCLFLGKPGPAVRVCTVLLSPSAHAECGSPRLQKATSLYPSLLAKLLNLLALWAYARRLWLSIGLKRGFHHSPHCADIFFFFWNYLLNENKTLFPCRFDAAGFPGGQWNLLWIPESQPLSAKAYCGQNAGGRCQPSPGKLPPVAASVGLMAMALFQGAWREMNKPLSSSWCWRRALAQVHLFLLPCAGWLALPSRS